jgi:DNA excision repair protein ERCC-1
MSDDTKRARFQNLADDIVRKPHQTPYPIIPPPPQTTTTTTTTSTTPPPPPPTFRNARTLVAHSLQKSNISLLQYLKEVKIEYSSMITSDFDLSDHTSVLFLSVQYAKLHANYLLDRISKLRKCKLRILLILIDDKDCETILLTTQSLAVNQNMSVIVAFSNAEAARWLELFVANKTKSISSIEHKPNDSDFSIVMDALTEIKSISKTNVKTLMAEYGTVRHVFEAKMDELSLCHGIGDKKVLALHQAFNEPFFTSPTTLSNSSSTNYNNNNITTTIKNKKQFSTHMNDMLDHESDDSDND